MPKTKQVTVKERRLIKGVVSGKSIKQSAIDAGYSERSAREIGSEALTKPTVKRALIAALERAGIYDDQLASVMKDGLEAQDGKGNKDLNTRHKYLDTALKVRGDYAPDKHEVLVGTLADLFKRMEESKDG